MQRPSGKKFLVLRQTLEERILINTDLKLQVVSPEPPVTTPHRKDSDTIKIYTSSTHLLRKLYSARPIQTVAKLITA